MLASAIIAPHVGERVEVTGVIAGTAQPRGTSGTLDRDSNQPPKLRVESLRRISTNSTVCTS
jgi:hypothetical protein